ncbi:MAG TPA: DUF892 family protein [Saprospiraceae bacterium]|nr:DUF892 family protein [Saprospiraceae bacterium]
MKQLTIKPGKPLNKKPAAKKQASQATTLTESKNNISVRSFFEDQLKETYWSQKAWLQFTPKMIINTTHSSLIDTLRQIQSATEQQLARCEQVFSVIGLKMEPKKSEGAEGLIKEANSILNHLPDGNVRDAGFLCAAQKLIHYEIAAYNCLNAYAHIIGEPEAAELLEETLDETKDAEELLTDLMLNIVNSETPDSDEDEEEEEELDDDDDEEEEEEENGIDDYEEEEDDDLADRDYDEEE